MQTGRMWLLGFLLLAVLLMATACTLQEPAEQTGEIEPPRVVGGDAERGAEAIRTYGCDSCHTIPGIATANALVGPPLDSWADRRYIAGKFPNEPEILVQWIRFPQAFEPGTAMPNLGIPEQDARDIAAYLFTLRREQPWIAWGEWWGW